VQFVGGDVVVVAVAVTGSRQCSTPRCFDILGLARGPGSIVGVAEFARLRFEFPANGGASHLLLNPPATIATSKNRLPLVPHPSWYIVRIVGVYVRDGNIRRDVDMGEADTMLVDTGANMLGVPPTHTRRMHDALREGGDLVFRLQGEGDAVVEITVPMVMHGGTELLLDSYDTHGHIVLGGRFMRGLSIELCSTYVAIANCPPDQ
tara:strand:- start:262 stop:879 length:618 start_codon:yes stop_codon:yes gene_type:complete